MADNDLLQRAFTTIISKLSTRNKQVAAEEIEYLEQFVSGKLSPVAAHWADPDKKKQTLEAMRKAGKARRVKLSVVYELTGEKKELDYEAIAELCGIDKKSVVNQVSKGGGQTTLQTRQADIITIYK